MVETAIRTPQDEDDQRLLDDGWEFSGLGLFKHPLLPNKHYTKEKALEEHMGYYCPMCGACGEPGCCPPNVCKCLYGDHYKTDYRLLEKDWDVMFQFIDRFTDPSQRIDKYLLAKEAKQLLATLPSIPQDVAAEIDD